jgi:hypothetical protein
MKSLERQLQQILKQRESKNTKRELQTSCSELVDFSSNGIP